MKTYLQKIKEASVLNHRINVSDVAKRIMELTQLEDWFIEEDADYEVLDDLQDTVEKALLHIDEEAYSIEEYKVLLSMLSIIIGENLLEL